LFFLSGAKIVKGIKNIFTKPLARKKRLCIFALGFRTIKSWSQISKIFIKVFKDTKQ
jgi:hypothetical protein